jgi:4-amino-4-deoxy-L-arabinose transferase-like glycosyltransferase
MTDRAMTRLCSIAVIACFCAPLFVGLGRWDLRNDEAIYSFAVDRILEIGDWLVPKSSPFENAAFLEKPPLKFWIVAAGIRFGRLPHDEFGLRFWDALFGGVAFVYVFLIGRRLAGPVCGAAAVMILFVHTPLLFEHGLRSNNMEAPLLLAYCGGVYHFLAWAEASHASRSTRQVMAVALYFVLGFMTKFVAALFLPLLLGVSGVVVPSYRTRLARDWRSWLGAAMLVGALVVPWFVFAWTRFRDVFWEVMLGQHVVTRFTGYLDRTHLQPWHYYFSTAYLELAHSRAALVVGVGLILLVVQMARRRRPLEFVMLLWFGLPLALMSFGTSKLYHYAYPFLPPLALAGGCAPAMLFEALRRPAERLAGTASRWSERLVAPMPAAMRAAPLRSALAALAVGALGLAAVTAISGPLRLDIADLVVIRNSTILRPVLLAVASAAIGGRLGAIVRFALALLVVGTLPTGAYVDTVARLDDRDSPLRSIRDCVARVRAETRADAAGLPALYVEVPHRQLYHPVYYYLRTLRPWDRTDEPSDGMLFRRVHAGQERTAALVTVLRYDDFVNRLRTLDERFVLELSAQAGVSPDVVRSRARETPVASFTYADTLLLLPGPYTICSPDVGGPVTR